MSRSTVDENGGRADQLAGPAAALAPAELDEEPADEEPEDEEPDEEEPAGDAGEELFDPSELFDPFAPADPEPTELLDEERLSVR